MHLQKCPTFGVHINFPAVFYPERYPNKNDRSADFRAPEKNICRIPCHFHGIFLRLYTEGDLLPETNTFRRTPAYIRVKIPYRSPSAGSQKNSLKALAQTETSFPSNLRTETTALTSCGRTARALHMAPSQFFPRRTPALRSPL